MEKILKDKNLSETPFRKEVLAVFAKYDNAISLSVIEENLKNFNRITLYRTIKIFIEKGIIHEIAISGEASNYAICQKECTRITHTHKHIHFKCTSCSVVTCVNMDKFPTILLPNYKITQLEIQASGLCEKCNRLN
jgi:Fur family ferric uptake transcriptional regulator